MITDPRVVKSLEPMTGHEDALAIPRVAIDREKIISRMVEASLVPAGRAGSRARLAGLALAASLALASWGGAKWWEHRAAPARSGIEVVALRGSVTGVQSGTPSALRVGAKASLDPKGTLETSRDGEARVKTSAGVEIELLENTKISLSDLGAAGTGSAMRLDRGRVRCVVPHHPGRTFSVVTAAARVVDIGTIFSVIVEQTATGPKTVVHVEEGEVRVEFPGGQIRLTASQSWVSAQDPRRPFAEASPAPVAAGSSPARPNPRRDSVKPHPETLAAEAQLLRLGLASEQRGDLRAAVTAFEALTARYPDSQLMPDAKAALARVKVRLGSEP